MNLRTIQAVIQKVSLAMLLCSLVFLTGCGGHVYHVVKRGETLYSIGWVYGYDYRQVAKWNHIKSPYYLSPGQRLRVAPPAGQYTASLQEYQPDKPGLRRKSGQQPAPVVGPAGQSSPAKGSSKPQKPSTVKKEARNTVSKVKEFFGIKTLNWRWPTNSRRIAQTFSSKDPTRQGIDISGKLGSPVKVAAPGKVVYAGSGLALYGKLIIVKHNEKYLSAYAHNQKLHVKEGDVVKNGQVIAKMGSISASGRTGPGRLHFEIRRNGKPVNPLSYLPRK